ncbi:MAG: cardiolipin synthase, partial [Planctomycetota bacterium]
WDCPEEPGECDAARVPQVLAAHANHFRPMTRLVAQLTGRALLDGNQVLPLRSGHEAYPAMLKAINGAQRSILFSSYIFDTDVPGQEFVSALGGAVERGVEVRVLLDGIGCHYSRPSVIPALERAGVRVRTFLPNRLPWRLRYANLRNHRKILVVDGHLGFTGGMNIRHGNLLPAGERGSVNDLHFQIEGPAVFHMQETAARDWAFVTREILEGETWFPDLHGAGDVLARGISDGPDEDIEVLRLTLLGAIGSAETSIQIVTPYFLPDQALLTALTVAVLRGVQVDVALPEKSNLKLVQWATTSQLWQILQRGVRVWASPPPFDHTKLFVVDGVWSLIGSTNWDARSLRLNFEFNVECYDRVLAERLSALVAEKISGSKQVTLQQVNGRSLPTRLRDGLARLLTPYL